MELKELFVVPRSRGEGIGSALLAWIEQAAIAADVHRIDWHVKRENDRGIGFYQKFGATIVNNRLSMRKSLPMR